MTAVVGVFDEREAAIAAEELLDAAGFGARIAVARALPDDAPGPPRLERRGERMLRGAVKWGILGSLLVEGPSLVAVIAFPLDLNVKVLVAATMWKFGAAFGSWIGAMAATEEGLDDEVAAEYEHHLACGRSLIAVDVPARLRPGVRGALLESGALGVRDVRGAFALKRPARSARGVSGRA